MKFNLGLKTLLFSTFLLSGLPGPAGATDGIILGPYEKAMVCRDLDLDLSCDGPSVLSDVNGRFALDGDGAVLARLVLGTVRVDGDDRIPVERALLFIAPAEAPAIVGGLSSVVAAHMARGMTFKRALRRVARNLGVSPRNLLRNPDAVNSEALRARLLQGGNDAAEDIRLALASDSDEQTLRNRLIEALAPKRRPPPEAQCGRLYRDPLTEHWHWSSRPIGANQLGIHFVVDVASGRFRVISKTRVRCSETHTTVTGRALGGELFGAAELCLDSTGDGSCADEASGYRTRTNGAGRYMLANLPNELLNDYPLLATSVDGHRLQTPGVMALVNDGKTMLSPMISVIARYAELYEINFAELYKRALRTFDLPDALNLGMIDYAQIAMPNNASTDALALFDELLLADADYDAFMTGKQFSENYFERVEDAFAGFSETPWPEPVDAKQLRALFGAKALYEGYFEITDADPLLVGSPAPTDPLGPAPTTIYDGEEYQQVFDAADTSDTIRGIVIAGVTDIPYVGQIVGTVLDFAWPAANPTGEILDLLYRDAQRLIRDGLILNAQNGYRTDVRDMTDSMKDFAKLTEPENQQRNFELAYVKSESILNRIFGDDEFGHVVLPLFVQSFVARMSLSRERLLHRELLASGDSDAAVREAFLYDYKKLRDRLFVGEAGRSSLLQRYTDWRHNQIETSWGIEGGFLEWTYCVGTVRDNYHGWVIKFQKHRDDCRDADPDFFQGSVVGVETRLRDETRLQVGKVLASAYLLSRLMPEDLVASDPDLTDTERLGETGYYVPDGLKSIWVGPYSIPCVRYTSAEIDNASIPVCEYTNERLMTTATPIKRGVALSLPILAAAVGPDLYNEAGDLALFWGKTPIAELPFSRYIVDIVPPNSDHSLIGLKIGLAGGLRSPVSTSGTTWLELIFGRRDADEPTHPVLYFSQVSPPGDFTEEYVGSVGSLDYKLSGLKRADVPPEPTPKSIYSVYFMEYAFFPDGNRRVD